MLCSPTIDANLNKLNESDLLELLKNYFRLCRQLPDKQLLIKDQTLTRLLCALLTDQRPSVSIYICKILLSLSEKPEDARALAELQELKKQLERALSVDDEKLVVPPRVFGKLLTIKTRISNANSPSTSPNEKSNKKTKQLTFAFDRPSDAQRRDMERKCISVPGVVSICFSQNGPNETRCMVRCAEHVEDKVLVRNLLSAGNLEMVKQFMRMRGMDGKPEVFEYYASQLEIEEREHEVKHKENVPKYLDDDQQIFESNQCIATKEQVNAQSTSGGWMSTFKSMLW